MKTGIELIAEERSKGYDNLTEKDFAVNIALLSKGIQFAYERKSELRIEVLQKTGALIAAEIDRLQTPTT